MRVKVGDYERVVEWTPAYDKRSNDERKNYGIHGMNLRFLLIGPKGAVQFLVYTNFHLPSTRRYLDDHEQKWNGTYKPMAADLGYHALAPLYEGQTLTREKCEYTGGDCYSDGSAVHADAVFDLFTEKGEDALWECLEWAYRSTLCGEKVPEYSALLSKGWARTRAEAWTQEGK